MKKIEQLTPEQIAKFPEYVDTWLKIGLSTDTNKKEAEYAIDKVYACAGLKPPKFKIWLRSPLEGCIGSQILLSKNQIQVRAQVRDQVGAQVYAQVGAQVRDQVYAQVYAQVGAQVDDQVYAQVRAQVGAQVGAQVDDQVYRACYGSHDANWLAWCCFFYTEGLVQNIEKILGLISISKYCGWFWPFENFVILTEKPLEINMRDKRLHADGKPAIRYSDGFSVWALNGVRVPKEIAETPANKLDPKLILKERNAEIRREIVRKIGIERVLESLGATVKDKMDAYELVDINLGDGRYRPYLKMLNPSIGTWHVEGVHPDCKTVKEALAWRNGDKQYIRPEVLT